MSSPPARSQVTQVLLQHDLSETARFERLLPLVYEDLRRMARRHLRGERPGHTLSTTDLVHESYLNLVDRSRGSWNDRAHFFAVAARAMRHVLIDYARKRNAQKRGGGRDRVPLDPRMVSIDEDAADLLALDEALTALADHDARLVKVVECRFFGGLTVDETASALDVSKRTVERDWTRAKAYLQHMLQSGE